MHKETVLVIEDDKNIARLVKYNFDRAGFACLVAATGEDALHLTGRERVDLILLDLMLPGMDGFEVCRRLKKAGARTSSTPIIILTARGEEVDRIVGFELGADDYVVKPFSPRELVLRARAILRRRKQEEPAPDVLEAGKLAVDVARRRVTVSGKDVELTKLEFDLLATLLRRRGRVQTRETLSADVWDMSSDVATRTIDTHIKRLRQKLGKAGAQIETVRGLGYRFSEDTTR
ncbi:MAG: response regulator transcription factor [Candidatus Eisenbacteria bacterium]|nr:response regulator transcription factor [Candidatus Eisenbacteria bacterium]